MKNKIANSEQAVQLNEQDLLETIDLQKLPRHIPLSWMATFGMILEYFGIESSFLERQRG